MRVRMAGPADLPHMAAIEDASFADPWPRQAFEELLGTPQARCTVAAPPEGPIVGYCILLLAGPEGDVANIATDPRWRGRRVAGRLLGEAIAAARAQGVEALFLEVREGNAPARALYARHGFVQVGRRGRYYRHPNEDALVLRCVLAPEAPTPPSAFP